MQGRLLGRAARLVGLALAIGLGAALPAAQAQDQGMLVFAAASLKNALDEVAAAWQERTGKTATISYAASSVLAKQIEEGAPGMCSSRPISTGWIIWRSGT
jgi:molybdate transport system substrate-binding protein